MHSLSNTINPLWSYPSTRPSTSVLASFAPYTSIRTTLLATYSSSLVRRMRLSGKTSILLLRNRLQLDVRSTTQRVRRDPSAQLGPSFAFLLPPFPPAFLLPPFPPAFLIPPFPRVPLWSWRAPLSPLYVAIWQFALCSLPSWKFKYLSALDDWRIVICLQTII